MFSSSVHTSLRVPASTPSGLSVVSLITSTGTSYEGHSSWIPPESVRQRKDLASKLWQSKVSMDS